MCSVDIHSRVMDSRWKWNPGSFMDQVTVSLMKLQLFHCDARVISLVPPPLLGFKFHAFWILCLCLGLVLFDDLHVVHPLITSMRKLTQCVQNVLACPRAIYSFLSKYVH